MKAQLTAKLELAKFLQDTTEEMAKMLSSKRTGDVQATAAELYDFMKRVRSGARVSNDDIKRFAKLFNDEITLDSVDRCVALSRPAAPAACRCAHPSFSAPEIADA